VETKFRLLVATLLCTWSVQGQSSRGTTLALSIAPECSIGIVSLSPAVPNSHTLSFRYTVRTSVAGGQGQIRLRFTAASPTDSLEGSNVDYRTTLAGPGTGASGSNPAADALTSGIIIARFGPRASSSRAGDAGTVQFTVNTPPGVLLELLEPSFSITCQ
jgi:hypothetical protein